MKNVYAMYTMDSIEKSAPTGVTGITFLAIISYTISTNEKRLCQIHKESMNF